jgi:(p)ppGpp synthase/HD superfamily hydrolase
MSTSSVEEPRLGALFNEALEYAMALHRFQKRKSTEIPYAGHLLGVCSIVVDAGGTEDEAIAALLHDGPEDQGGRATLLDIKSRFGSRVAGIVEHLSDTFEAEKPAWRKRKEDYLMSLRACQDASVYLVSAADKLHNLRSMLDDYREVGETLWKRFSAPLGRSDVLWYHDALLDIYESGPKDDRRTRIVRDMRATIDAIRSARRA